jgi:3-methyladenine DNA glycosylase/8-oxoguanine DNA glycosylase
MNLVLEAQTPFNLRTVIHSHGWIQLAPFDNLDGVAGFQYIDQLHTGRVIEMKVLEKSPGVSVEVGAQLSPDESEEITDKVAWMLGLDQDFSTFYALAQGEPKLAQAATKAQGRILRSATLFEDTVKTILTTNTAWSGTIRMVQNLVAQFGPSLPGNPGKRAFPTPAQLAEADEETLRNQTRLGYRSPYVLELAQKVASGKLDMDAFKNLEIPTPELRKQLLSIKGVGDYAAANLLVLLGRFDFIPVDSWAFKMVSHEWYGGEPIGRSEVEAGFEDWGDWKGLAFWFWDWSYGGDSSVD